MNSVLFRQLILALTSIIEILLPVLLSLITTIIVVKYQFKVEKKKEENIVIVNNLKSIRIDIINNSIVSPQKLNEYFLLTPNREENDILISSVRTYNSKLYDYKSIIKNNLILLYLSINAIDPASTYMEYQLDDDTNDQLNKMADLLSHENWKEWLIEDYKVVNFFKRSVSRNTSEGFEFLGIEHMMNAFSNPVEYEKYKMIEFEEMYDANKLKREILDLQKYILDMINKKIDNHK